MALQNPEGAPDLLPEAALFWDDFRSCALALFKRYGYALIETPLFEQTELFVRGIGEATDVVSKEMFSVVSGENLKKLLQGDSLKAKSNLTLRPEGTAGVVRAVVQHNLVPAGAPPVKLVYAGPMFRSERPQKGRQRQFYSVGIECLGSAQASVDAESIIILMRFFEQIGIPSTNMRLIINSLGCPSCRPAYRQAIRLFMDKRKEQLCDECVRRAAVNPLRSFDCKNPQCRSVMLDAPLINDYLCPECISHDKVVKHYLQAAGLCFTTDARLVRGLDYYMRTVFEVQVVEGLGAQNAICGGGRYDRLTEQVGGLPTPGFGWALGFERCVLALRGAGLAREVSPACDMFVASVNEQTLSEAFVLAQAFRDAGLVTQIDHQKRSLKAQFKLADKLGAKMVAVIGPDEQAAGVVSLRDMDTHEKHSITTAALSKALTQIKGRFDAQGRLDGHEVLSLIT